MNYDFSEKLLRLSGELYAQSKLKYPEYRELSAIHTRTVLSYTLHRMQGLPLDYDAEQGVISGIEPRVRETASGDSVFMPAIITDMIELRRQSDPQCPRDTKQQAAEALAEFCITEAIVSEMHPDPELMKNIPDIGKNAIHKPASLSPGIIMESFGANLIEIAEEAHQQNLGIGAITHLIGLSHIRRSLELHLKLKRDPLN